ncbi:MAG: helix-turn-helix domain-containing protein [Cyclobacteriaceae bacterium]
MPIEISIISFLYLIGGIQAFFIAGYLLLKKNGPSQVALYLAILLIGLFLTLYDYFIIDNELYREVSHFLLLSFAWQLAYAPLIFLMTRTIVIPQKEFTWQDTLHFIPAGLHLLYGIATFHLHSLMYKSDYIEGLLVSYDPSDSYHSLVFQVFNFAIAAQLITYIVMSYRRIREYGAQPKHKHYLNIDKVNRYYWSIVGITVILLVASLDIPRAILSLTGLDIGAYMLVFLSLYLFYLAYFIVLNPEVFEKPRIKYQDSALAESRKKELVDLLNKHMTREQPHHSENITVKALAASLDISDRELSQIINEELGLNFYDFINYHRIEDAKVLLTTESGRKFSILGIAYEVGFNSKSSFYTAFKKFTGTTPSSFQKKL